MENLHKLMRKEFLWRKKYGSIFSNSFFRKWKDARDACDNRTLLFQLSVQVDTENCFYSELVGETWKVEIKFNFSLEQSYWTRCIGARKFSVAVNKFFVDRKFFGIDDDVLLQSSKRLLLLKYRYIASFPSDCGPTFTKETFFLQEYATQQNAGRALVNDFKLKSQNKFCNLSDVELTVSSGSNTSIRSHSHYSPLPSFAVSARFVLLFLPSSSRINQLLVFKMLMSFQW